MTIQERLALLQTMPTCELRRQWRRLFGEEPRSGNILWMRKRLAWAIQAQEFGGLSEAAQRRIDELIPLALAWMPLGRRAFQAGNEPIPPVERSGRGPKPGSVITRRYKGRTLVVTVRESGFEFDGRLYGSLTALAKAVTGSHWNGHLFFFGRPRKEKSA